MQAVGASSYGVFYSRIYFRYPTESSTARIHSRDLRVSRILLRPAYEKSSGSIPGESMKNMRAEAVLNTAIEVENLENESSVSKTDEPASFDSPTNKLRTKRVRDRRRSQKSEKPAPNGSKYKLGSKNTFSGEEFSVDDILNALGSSDTENTKKTFVQSSTSPSNATLESTDGSRKNKGDPYGRKILGKRVVSWLSAGCASFAVELINEVEMSGNLKKPGTGRVLGSVAMSSLDIVEMAKKFILRNPKPTGESECDACQLAIGHYPTLWDQIQRSVSEALIERAREEGRAREREEPGDEDRVGNTEEGSWKLHPAWTLLKNLSKSRDHKIQARRRVLMLSREGEVGGVEYLKKLQARVDAYVEDQLKLLEMEREAQMENLRRRFNVKGSFGERAGGRKGAVGIEWIEEGGEPGEGEEEVAEDGEESGIGLDSDLESVPPFPSLSDRERSQLRNLILVSSHSGVGGSPIFSLRPASLSPSISLCPSLLFSPGDPVLLRVEPLRFQSARNAKGGKRHVEFSKDSLNATEFLCTVHSIDDSLKEVCIVLTSSADVPSVDVFGSEGDGESARDGKRNELSGLLGRRMRLESLNGLIDDVTYDRNKEALLRLQRVATAPSFYAHSLLSSLFMENSNHSDELNSQSDLDFYGNHTGKYTEFESSRRSPESEIPVRESEEGNLSLSASPCSLSPPLSLSTSLHSPPVEPSDGGSVAGRQEVSLPPPSSSLAPSPSSSLPREGSKNFDESQRTAVVSALGYDPFFRGVQETKYETHFLETAPGSDSENSTRREVSPFARSPSPPSSLPSSHSPCPPSLSSSSVTRSPSLPPPVSYSRSSSPSPNPSPPLSFPLSPAPSDSPFPSLSLPLSPSPLVCIHGPPGTGKTSVILEIVRNCIVQKERVLICAPTNAAVDNIAERLGERGREREGGEDRKFLRIGNPVRVSSSVLEMTFDYKVESLLRPYLEDFLRRRAMLRSDLRQLEEEREKERTREWRAGRREEIRKQRQTENESDKGDVATKGGEKGDEEGEAGAHLPLSLSPSLSFSPSLSSHKTAIAGLKQSLKRLVRALRAKEREVVSSVIADAQVVLSTTTGAGDPSLLRFFPLPFDLVIVDEAGQANQPSSLIPLLLGKRAVLAGDPSQLPPTILSERARREGFGLSLMERVMRRRERERRAGEFESSLQPSLSLSAAPLSPIRGGGREREREGEKGGGNEERERKEGEGERTEGEIERDGNGRREETTECRFAYSSDREEGRERRREIGGAKVEMLTVQYRMHKAISDWSSTEMYGGRLHAHAEVAGRLLSHMDGVQPSPLTSSPFLLLDTRRRRGALDPYCEEKRGKEFSNFSTPSHDGLGLDALSLTSSLPTSSSLSPDSLCNEGEAEAVIKLVDFYLDSGVSNRGISVISPYVAQVQLLRSLLGGGRGERGGEQVEVATVDSFQGREAEVVIISMVRSNPHSSLGFLLDRRRMNVAVTRAKRQVAIVCDSSTVSTDKFLFRLLLHAKENGIHIFADEREIYGL